MYNYAGIKINSLICMDKENFIARNQVATDNNPEDKFKTMLFLSIGNGRITEGGLRTKGYFKRSLPDKPLVTIITVALNSEKYIEKTILSVANQTYDNVEYLIVDGVSSDMTVDIIKKYENIIDYWVSEQDNGTSEAINKAICLALGDIIGIIGSDDWYENDAVSTIVKEIKGNKDGMIFCGQVRKSDGCEKGQVYISRPCELKKDMTIETMGVFLKKSVLKKYGVFNLKYKIVNDYELFLRFYMNNIKFVTINKVVTNMRSRGMSEKKWLTAFNEIRCAQIEYVGRSTVSTIRFIYKVTRFLIKDLLIKIKFNFLIHLYRKYFSRNSRRVN